jgi:UDP-GlcNAc:undecaprenyl-phosphate GlcNAc-1-phosphate transferase
VVLAAGAMFAVGLIDDVRDMSAPAKMAGPGPGRQHPVLQGVTMYEFKIPLAGFFVLTPGIIPLITAAWVIALTNAINLIDGLDGLAAGVVAIGGGALAIYGIRLQGLGLLPERQHRAAGGGGRLRDLPGLPPLQLQPGAHLHG